MNMLSGLSSQYPGFIPSSLSNSSSAGEVGSQPGSYRTVSVYVSETVSTPDSSSDTAAQTQQTASQPVTWSETGASDTADSSATTAKAVDLLNALIQARAQQFQNASSLAGSNGSTSGLQDYSSDITGDQSLGSAVANSQASTDSNGNQSMVASNPYPDAYAAAANASYSPITSSAVSAYA